MLEHINELLASLPEGDEDEDEDMSEEPGTEDMDVQEEDSWQRNTSVVTSWVGSVLIESDHRWWEVSSFW